MHFECPDWPPDWPEISRAVEHVIRSGDWGRYHSDACRDLQRRLQEFSGASHARLCCSGTAALEIALRAAQVRPGDDVVLAAYDFPGNFRTVELLGARPVLLDLADDSLSVDPAQLESLGAGPLAKRVRAVIATHLYGTAAAIERICQVCDEQDWVLIEDACQVPGMIVRGQPIGTFGHLATLSFGGSKPVSGGGGAVLANDSRVAARLGALMDRPGETFPLSSLQASVIAPQLARLEQLNRLRLETARFLQQQMAPQLEPWCWLSRIEDQVQPTYYKVAWLAPSAGDRERIIAAAPKFGLPIGAGFRSLSLCSDRRCAKPFSTPKSDRLGQRLFVLDHRALILPPERHQQLGDALRALWSSVN